MFAPATTTHGTLLARVADPNDPTAWPEFCAQYEELIRGFARRKGVVGADADDVVQEVLLALTKAMPGFEYNPAKGKFRAYLKTIVVRGIVRRRQREFGVVHVGQLDEASRVAADDEAIDAVWEEEWRQQHLRRAMRTIEAEFNAADMASFRAYVLDGEEAAAVGSRMGMTAAQVYQAKYRILGRLKTVIAGQVEDEG